MMVQANAPGPTRRGGLNRLITPEDIEHTLKIAGCHCQTHFSFYLLQPPQREISLIHAAFHYAERVLDDFFSAFQLFRMQAVPAFHIVQHLLFC
jgi:hypothetical protein